MAEVASAYVTLLPSAKGFGKQTSKQISGDLDGAGKSGGGAFVGGFKGALVGLGAVIGVGVIKDAVGGIITAASDAGESVNAVRVSYGDAADEVLRLGDNAAKGLGLSSTEFNGIATQFSSFAGTIAGESGNVVGVLDELSGRGADFASVFNLDVNDALGLFQSGLAGETEPLRQYGVDLSAAAVEAYAAANGIGEAGRELTEQEKVQARYGALLEQTSKVQGDFANTSDGLANQQRILGAEFDNVKAQLGQALLPAATAVVSFLASSAVPAFKALLDGTSPLSPALASVGGFIQGTVVPALQSLGGFITGSVLPALSTFGGYLQATVLPVLQTMAAYFMANIVPALQAFGSYLVATVVPALQAFGAFLVSNVLPVLQSLGAYIVGTVVPALVSIGQTIAATVVPIVQELVKQFQANVLPALLKVWSVIQGQVVPVLIRVGNVIVPLIATLARLVGEILQRVVPAVLRFAGPILGGLISVLGSVIGWIARAVGAVIDFGGKVIDAGRKVGEFAGTVRDKIGEAVDYVRELPGRVQSSLSGFGDLLKEKGRALIDGLISGIRDKIDAVRGAISEVASAVGDFFPGSPVKTGPLKSWNRGGAGKRLVGMLAGGIDSSLGDVRAASGRLASSVASPMIGDVGLAAAGAAAGGGGDTFNAYGADPEAVYRTWQQKQRAARIRAGLGAGVAA